MRTLLTMALLLCWVAPASAVNFYDELHLQMDVLQTLNTPSASEAKASKQCRQRYERLFQDGTLNVLIGFGYSDSVPHDVVFDWYMVNGFRMALTEKCRPGISACGFKAVASKSDVFERTMKTPQGRTVRVEVTLLRPSLSGSHAQNTSAHNRERQLTLCQSVENRFYQELERGPEVVYYSGHSRNGGAPDFCPPRVRADGHVDYPWYQRQRPGLNRLLQSLRLARTTQILAMHSCDSTRHYRRRVLNIRPEMAIFSTPDLVKMAPDFRNQYGGLDALLSQRCEEGLQDSMTEGLPMDIHGMF